MRGDRIRRGGAVAISALLALVWGCGGGDLEVYESGSDSGVVVPDGGLPLLRDTGNEPLPDTSTPERPDTGGDEDEDEDMGPVIDPGPYPNQGWIGGPCSSETDCEYDDALCLTDDHPDGQCSLECDRFCPDRDGENSVTFCVDKGGAGRCVSQCDFDLYPDAGCREGYSCQIVGRFGEPGTERAVCLPGEPMNPDANTPCLRALDEAGIIWTPWDYATQYDDGLACTIDDPIRVTSPINGIEYRYYNQSTPGTMSMACELALALNRLGDVLKQHDLDTVLHIGTFNCRKIGGSNRLSQHGYGMAIDIWGFEDAAGDDYILERDWEHGTTTPQGRKAKTLYDVGQAMYDEKIFNIVLTPNYNAAHDNHFHVDLTDGGDFIGLSFGPEYYFGNDEAMWDAHCH